LRSNSPTTDRFRARYDDSGLLLLDRDNRHDWPHGATLDGLLMLDLDDVHVLVHVELAWPRSRWPSGDVELPHPDRTSQSLRLPGLSTDSLTESPDVTVIEGTDVVLMSWKDTHIPRRVPVGDGITALVVADLLAGFAIELDALSS